MLTFSEFTDEILYSAIWAEKDGTLWAYFISSNEETEKIHWTRKQSGSSKIKYFNTVVELYEDYQTHFPTLSK